ncbi:MAG: hypothetical protein WDZ37_01575 [Solirubrobacterales bacterium]
MAAAGSSRRAAAGRTATAPRALRRVSGPARAPGRGSDRPVGLRPLPVLGTIGSHALRAGKSLHDSSLLDRLLRGRGWIALLGVLLIGLVALNVSLLKLNAQAGRNAEEARKLRIANTELGATATRLSSAERLQAAGEKLGLVMPPPGSIHFLRSRKAADGKFAARMIKQGAALPDATAIPVVVDPASSETGAPVETDPVTTQPAPAAPAEPVAEAPATGGGTVPAAGAGTPGAG